MVTDKEKIAVTGMAWTTALGDSLAQTWKKLLAGKSGFIEVPCYKSIKNLLAAVLTGDQFSQLTPRARFNALALDVINRVLIDAKLTPAQRKTACLIVGTSFGDRLDSFEHKDSFRQWGESLTTQLDIKEVITLSTACSAGSDAVLLGAELIRSRYTDICICGGVDILTDTKRLAHDALGTLSSKQLRSFDKSRDGSLFGEGAGFLVLESAMRSENSKKHAYIAGWGSANDASGLTAPNPEGIGAELAIRRAIAVSGMEIRRLGVVNAHGSGTLINDRIEANVYERIFSKTRPLIFATKGNFGHTLGATGAIEAVALILALQTKQIPPVPYLDDPIDSLKSSIIYNNHATHDSNIGMSLTLGFGGFDTALIVKV